MTVTLAHRALAPTPDSAAVAATAITATRATTFLRAQSQWLQRGLLHGDDSIAVDIVLGAHDRSHDRWVALIDLVSRSLDAEAAQQVATLYAYFGRVAGSLEGEAMNLLSPDVAAHARQLQAQRLADLTEVTVESLWRAAAEV